MLYIMCEFNHHLLWLYESSLTCRVLPTDALLCSCRILGNADGPDIRDDGRCGPSVNLLAKVPIFCCSFATPIAVVFMLHYYFLCYFRCVATLNAPSYDT